MRSVQAFSVSTISGIFSLTRPEDKVWPGGMEPKSKHVVHAKFNASKPKGLSSITFFWNFWPHTLTGRGVTI